MGKKEIIIVCGNNVSNSIIQKLLKNNAKIIVCDNIPPEPTIFNCDELIDTLLKPSKFCPDDLIFSVSKNNLYPHTRLPFHYYKKNNNFQHKINKKQHRWSSHGMYRK